MTRCERLLLAARLGIAVIPPAVAQSRRLPLTAKLVFGYVFGQQVDRYRGTWTIQIADLATGIGMSEARALRALDLLVRHGFLIERKLKRGRAYERGYDFGKAVCGGSNG
jgi:hypothetical protein